jgi:hypothetical protein
MFHLIEIGSENEPNNKIYCRYSEEIEYSDERKRSPRSGIDKLKTNYFYFF